MSFKKIISETEKSIVGATPLRKYQLKQRLKVLKALQAEAKTIKGAEEIEKLILKKDKFGRPFFSDYQEKLKALKDLQSNKYIDPKTSKVFTPKEWLYPTKPDGTKYSESSIATFRNKFRDPDTFKKKKKEYQKEYMAEKKKDPEFRKKYKEARTEEYFKKAEKIYKVDKGAGKGVLQLQDNRLLGYLLTAANKQKKNLKGTDTTPQFEEVIKDKKFAGVKDNKTGITYHHARYKGPLGSMDKLITDHPDFKNVKDLTKIAEGFKRSLPNATIASYFAKFDRVPTNAELYNFLSKDPKFVSKYTDQAMAKNSLELHHRLGVDVNPTKSLQLTPTIKNNTAGVIVEEFKKGNISKEEAAKQLKKINVRVKLPGTKAYVGAKDIAPTQAVGAAKREVSKMFTESLKTNPNLIEQIAERYKLLPIEGKRKWDKAINCADGCFVKELNNNPEGTLQKFARGIKNFFVPKPEMPSIKYDDTLGAFVNPATDDVVSQAGLKSWAADNPMPVKAGTSVKPGLLRKTGRAIAHLGLPLPTAALDSYFIGRQIKEYDKDATEIAKDPFNWLGLATMEPLTKAAGMADKSGKMASVMRLGMSPGMIRGATRFLGLPGLALSTGLTAYDQYKKYQNKEGFIYDLFNKEEIDNTSV